jgi:hypothetical protein
MTQIAQMQPWIVPGHQPNSKAKASSGRLPVLTCDKIHSSLCASVAYFICVICVHLRLTSSASSARICGLLHLRHLRASAAFFICVICVHLRLSSSAQSAATWRGL